jgi:broad specificity phosphatase PhoE
LIEIDAMLDIQRLRRCEKTWMMIRHGERGELLPGNDSGLTPLTERGMKEAFLLGQRLSESGFQISTVSTSPLSRCVQTADSILKGYGHFVPIETNQALGGPGPFVTECAPKDLFARLSVHEVVRRQCQEVPIEGIRSLQDGAKILFDSFMANENEDPRICALISHDAIVGPFLSYLTKRKFDKDNWIGYLDGFFLLRTTNGWFCTFNGQEYDVNEKIGDLMNVAKPILKP